ncbi:MAG: 2-oxo-4-hydroxy-4-carboxy-5-ureidoimidazoline decarboxylase [Spirulinaceae cyanobacterium]
MPHTIAALNRMDQAAFVAALGAVFEKTPAIAAQAWQQRPFADRAALQTVMVQVVDQMAIAAQLELIRAHPDLGSRAQMAAASVQEQAGAGLNVLSPEEYAQFQQLNQQYQHKFGFPFIIAVKRHSKSSILAAFTQRLQNPLDVERQQALVEICRIAALRLQDWVED